jgi:hypothetical protein
MFEMRLPMRITLSMAAGALPLAPVAHAQTYSPGQTPAAQGLQQLQLQTQQQQAQQLQMQQNALASHPGNPALQAQYQANQAHLRQAQQENLQTQMQLQQQQRQQLQQSMAPPPAP